MESNAAVGDRYKFTSREYDPETGLYYYRGRYYDPATGRFTTQDPIGFAAGDANLYRYVGNSPSIGTDPLGHATLTEFAETIASIAGRLLANPLGCFVVHGAGSWYTRQAIKAISPFETVVVRRRLVFHFSGD